MSAPPAITLAARGLSRNFGPRTAVQDVSLELKRGEVLGFLGPNGAGKTTTMQMLTGNLAPTRGSVCVCGIDLLDEPRSAKARIGYLPETPPLYRDLSVDDYLRLAARLHRVAKGVVGEAVEQVKRRCGLSDMGRRLIGALSRGFQQRVGIAQAIVHNPDVVILDEPTVGLDPIQIREIRGLIRELGGEHSVVLSTHILPEVESVCDRVQIMHQGRMVFGGSVEALRNERRAHILVLILGNAPAIEELRAVDGVTAVEQVSANEFRVHHAPQNDPSGRLAQLAVSRGWGLTQLAPAHASLEDVFLQLTQKENNAETANRER
ncbi:MAG: ABC transporter ATP-binding protein [Betaproteobacteria bacterium]|nr:ABC transporter ATP-binding protein [Betaproteobacteria bacterium]